MAAASVLRLTVDDKEYTASLRQAQQGMQHLEQALQATGKSFNQVDKSVVEYARGIGQMEAQSKTARGRVGEMSSAFVELSAQYNRMSAEVQRSDVGRALAQSMEELRHRTIAAKQELQQLNSQLGETKAPDMDVSGGGLLSGLGGKLSGAMQVFAGNMLTKAAGAIANLGTEMADMVRQGVELAKQGEGIRIAFERLGRGDILDGLREATHGTVTDIELMKAAVKFNDFKLPLEELGTMLAFAQQKAKDTGQSVDYMVDSIVTGLGRKSLMILDNLGLSAAEIKDKMAETGDMTKAVGAIIREQMAKAGDYMETAADRAAQANVSLQNKMEELGRKFAPVEEASSQLWTSMKIGILDIIGGPLATLLNQLTEAGRLKNQLNNMNGEPGSGNTKVQRMIDDLSKVSEGKRQGLYDRQVAEFYRYINRRENYMKERQRWVNNQDNEGLRQKLMSEQQAFGTSNVGDIKRQIDAAKIMLADYRQAAKQILSPVKADIDTKGAEQNVESLKVKLIELQAQRKKAIAAGDTDLSKNLAKQITQTKADIKGLGGTVSTSTTHKATPQERAADKVAEAERTYAETLQKNSIRLEAGLDSTLDNKKKELSAQERLFDAYNDAYATYKDPKYKEASAEAAEKIKQLAAEVKTATDAQEAAKKSAHELESAQKKLSDAQREMSEAMQSNDLKGQFTAEKKITAAQTDIDRLTPKTFDVTADTGDIMERLRDIQGVTIDDKTMTVTAETTEAATALQQMEGITLTPKTFAVTADTIQAEEGLKKLEGLTGDKEITLTATYTPGNLDALIGNLKERISQSDVGTDLYNALTKQLADAQMLGSFIEMAYKNGIDASTLDPQPIFSKIFGDGRTAGDYIPDEFWEGLGDLMGEHLGKGIKVDTNIGSVKEGEEKDDKFLENTQKVISGLSSVAGGLQQMGIKLPKGVSDVLNVANGLMSVINGVGIIISVFSNTSQSLNTAAVTVNTATIAASTATLTASITALIVALETNSATNFFPFANGGIVHAADGYFVPGNNYSGDMVPALLNSGELVLNRAQQNNLASQLQGSGLQNLRLSTEIDAESIKIILNNNGERTGDGEYIKATLG